MLRRIQQFVSRMKEGIDENERQRKRSLVADLPHIEDDTWIDAENGAGEEDNSWQDFLRDTETIFVTSASLLGTALFENDRESEEEALASMQDTARHILETPQYETIVPKSLIIPFSVRLGEESCSPIIRAMGSSTVQLGSVVPTLVPLIFPEGATPNGLLLEIELSELGGPDHMERATSVIELKQQQRTWSASWHAWAVRRMASSSG